MRTPFKEWYSILLEKANMHLDKDAALIMYERGASIYDAILALTNRRN